MELNYVQGKILVKKILLLLLVLSVIILGQTALAAPELQLVQTVDIVADKAVTPLDFSFFDQATPGRVELSNVKNLWGAGAGMIFYVNTDQGSDWLMLGFSGGMVEIRLQNKKIVLFSERVNNITGKTPLIMVIQDGKLTVSLGNRSRVIDGMDSFSGSLTTQSIEGTLKVYR